MRLLERDYRPQESVHSNGEQWLPQLGVLGKTKLDEALGLASMVTNFRKYAVRGWHLIIYFQGSVKG
ncbi:hypothetical protein HF876_04920 [Psychrobacillus sp. BL-248-WT-3]|nr:hypothetical protein [Psychrobacillus sp. BL-248-WT-3]